MTFDRGSSQTWMYYHREFRSGSIHATEQIKRKACRTRTICTGADGASDIRSVQVVQAQLERLELEHTGQAERMQSLEDECDTVQMEIADLERKSTQQDTLIHNLVRCLFDSDDDAASKILVAP